MRETAINREDLWNELCEQGKRAVDYLLELGLWEGLDTQLLPEPQTEQVRERLLPTHPTGGPDGSKEAEAAGGLNPLTPTRNEKLSTLHEREEGADNLGGGSIKILNQDPPSFLHGLRQHTRPPLEATWLRTG